MAPSPKVGFATRATHGDEEYIVGPEVAPNISLSTTFRHPSPDEIAAQKPGHYTSEWDPSEPSRDIYSRYTQPTLTRSEKVLSSLIGAPTTLYPSGIAAAFAILLLVRPDVIAVTGGYHGCHASFEVYRQMRGADNVKIIKLDDEYSRDAGKLLVWLETPLNPTGEIRSIEEYSKKAHAVGGVVAVDSTFAPPPVQDPFKWGADIVMHSATKYFGGHSDTLTGTVSVRDKAQWLQLWHNRTYTGANPGSMESWLILRSLRTLPLRITRQATTATALAQWLASLTRAAPGSTLDGPSGVIEEVWHGTLQKNASTLIGEGKQMSLGSACFAFSTTKPIYAEWLGHVLKLFVPATSLGGVESLIEQRSVSDPGADPRLIRLSIGLEDFEDLKADLIAGFAKVIEIEQGKVSKL
ncbi:Cys/Met metabolism PLP-dependent enzyme-domain-containing protein [Leucosporidium creatinivorum]|uniref:Cys/Met metabolism PLP-dependent enzyme-domain-containing protein n=1 Tax=Leucosporidium creatinivorum TaxID=106004 RepID=A0A1Y2FRP3_9BASI|nr:Cys/Met metabolism PLP-dependent enzyme-domain-containing protein [Leucosporidium creatinivorum]